jgi:hypothetical protein
MKTCLNKVTLSGVTIIILCLVFFNVSASFAADCTEDYYHLNVSGNSSGFIEFNRISCGGNSQRLWSAGFSVPGDGGGLYSGVEAILPWATLSPPLKYFPPQVGHKWQDQGSSGVYPVNSVATVTSVSETVEVTAGTFENCAKVEETLLYPRGYETGQPHPIKFERWFAPGVGPVKLLITHENDVLYSGELISHANITADPGDYLPLGTNYTWTFGMSDGRTATWTVDDSQSQAEYGFVSPRKKDFIPAGSKYTVIWGAPPEVTLVKLRSSLDNRLTWKVLSNNETGPNYAWDVPLVNGNKSNSLLKLIAYNGSGARVAAETTGPFTIEVVRLTSPNGGESSFSSHQEITISWTTYGTVSPVNQVQLSCSLDNGVTWKAFTVQPPSGSDPGSFPVPLPTVTKTKSKCKVKVVLKGASNRKLGCDVSDGVFTINP